MEKKLAIACYFFNVLDSVSYLWVTIEYIQCTDCS